MTASSEKKRSESLMESGNKCVKEMLFFLRPIQYVQENKKVHL